MSITTKDRTLEDVTRTLLVRFTPIKHLAIHDNPEQHLTYKELKKARTFWSRLRLEKPAASWMRMLPPAGAVSVHLRWQIKDQERDIDGGVEKVVAELDRRREQLEAKDLSGRDCLVSYAAHGGSFRMETLLNDQLGILKSSPFYVQKNGSDLVLVPGLLAQGITMLNKDAVSIPAEGLTSDQLEALKAVWDPRRRLQSQGLKPDLERAIEAARLVTR